MRVFLLAVQFVPFSNPSLANLFRYKTVSWYNLNMTANNQLEHINDNLRLDIIKAIRHVQTEIRWKSGKHIQHLTKRIRLGHLPPQTTLTEYEAIIATIVNDYQAKVYLFRYEDTPYPTLVTTVKNQDWLVMIGLDGIMETAFPPNDPETYLADPAYVYVGMLEELQK